jgi:hypothetical protein
MLWGFSTRFGLVGLCLGLGKGREKARKWSGALLEKCPRLTSTMDDMLLNSVSVSDSRIRS